jgi:prevent-host-death family protein
MLQINIHEAKTHLSALVDGAARGEQFIIAKSGKPMVMVTPITERAPGKRVGFLKGNFHVPDDFDTMGAPELDDMFGGEK